MTYPVVNDFWKNGGNLVSTKMDAIDDGDDTVKVDTLVLTGELTDLNCNWSGECAARSFYYNPSWVVLFWNQCRTRGSKRPLISSNASAILPTRVQHRHPLSISWTPSMFDSLASSLSTVVSRGSRGFGPLRSPNSFLSKQILYPFGSCLINAASESLHR